MKKIDKIEPGFFSKYISKKKPIKWDDIAEIRGNLREFILQKEQRNQCAYCEVSICAVHSPSHIDHFKRKHLFPELTFSYFNLLVSCNNPNRCASVKDVMANHKDSYKDIINPVEEEPNPYFE